MTYVWEAHCEKGCSREFHSDEPAPDPKWAKILCPYDETPWRGRVVNVEPKGTG